MSEKPSSENFSKDPLGGGTLFWRELTGVGDWSHGDELAELVAGLLHQAGNALWQLLDRLTACYRSRLELLDHLQKLGKLVGAVDLDHEQLSAEDLVVNNDGPSPRAAGPIGELVEQDRLP
jgi:hypothetical protein